MNPTTPHMEDKRDYLIEIRVMPRKGILDPQGSAVAGALASLGFGEVRDAHVGRLLRLEVSEPSEEAARERADAMCRGLLANPVTEDYEIEVRQAAGAT
jgi:phosphoribosylformylglycinamidine synthase subunit PurS